MYFYQYFGGTSLDAVGKVAERWQEPNYTGPQGQRGLITPNASRSVGLIRQTNPVAKLISKL